MTLRIPLTRDQTLQVEFHEIERRLRRLEKGTGVSSGGPTLVLGGSSSVSSVDLSPIYARLEALELASGSPADIPELVSVGAGAQAGIAPSPGTRPGPTGIGGHVLKEDATWGFPLRGLVQVATDGETEDPDTLDILGGLHVSGGLSADEIVTRTLTVLGILTPQGYLACCEDELTLT